MKTDVQVFWSVCCPLYTCITHATDSGTSCSVHDHIERAGEHFGALHFEYIHDAVMAAMRKAADA